MKSLILLLAIAVALPLIAQNFNSGINFPDSPNFFESAKQKIFRNNEAVVRPQVVLVDNNRYTYSYNGSGKLLSLTHEQQIAGTWMNYGKDVYEYNASGHLISYSGMYPDNNSWAVYLRELYTPDYNGNPTSIIRQVLDNGVLVNSDKKNYTYAGGGDVQSFVQQFWENGTWRNHSRNIYTYAGPGMVLIDLIGTWDTISGEWQDKHRYFYTYAGGGGFTSRVSQANPSGDHWYTLDSLFRTYSGNNITSETLLRNVNNYFTWQNEYRYIYTYDGAGNLLSHSREFSHYMAPHDWTREWILYYTYDGNNNMLSMIRRLWSGTVWNNHFRALHTYDQAGNRVETMTYVGSLQNWISDRKSVYTHDGFGNALTGSGWYYYDNQWLPLDADLYLFYNNKQDALYARAYNMSIEYNTGIEDEELSPSGFVLHQNYPNPFNPSTFIVYSLGFRGHVTMKLYDILGNEAATLVDEEKDAGTYNYKLSTLNLKLSSGVYFYQLRAGEFVSTKKMILLK